MYNVHFTPKKGPSPDFKTGWVGWHWMHPLEQCNEIKYDKRILFFLWIEDHLYFHFSVFWGIFQFYWKSLMSFRHLSFSKGFPSFSGKAGCLSSPSAGLTPIPEPSASDFSDFAESSPRLLGGKTCDGMSFEFWQNSPSNPGLHWHLRNRQMSAIFSHDILQPFALHHQYYDLGGPMLVPFPQYLHLSCPPFIQTKLPVIDNIPNVIDNMSNVIDNMPNLIFHIYSYKQCCPLWYTNY